MAGFLLLFISPEGRTKKQKRVESAIYPLIIFGRERLSPPPAGS